MAGIEDLEAAVEASAFTLVRDSDEGGPLLERFVLIDLAGADSDGGRPHWQYEVTLFDDPRVGDWSQGQHQQRLRELITAVNANTAATFQSVLPTVYGEQREGRQYAITTIVYAGN